MEKRKIHCHANIFSSNQLRVKFFSKKLIWRNFCDKIVAVKFHNFHSVLHSVKIALTYFHHCISAQKFREIKWFDDHWKMFSRNIFPLRVYFSFFQNVGLRNPRIFREIAVHIRRLVIWRENSNMSQESEWKMLE